MPYGDLKPKFKDELPDIVPIPCFDSDEAKDWEYKFPDPASQGITYSL